MSSAREHAAMISDYLKEQVEEAKVCGPFPENSSPCSLHFSPIAASSEMPFQSLRNVCHHLRSERKLLLRRMKWAELHLDLSRTIILRKNERPAVAACWSWPMSDSSSLLVEAL